MINHSTLGLSDTPQFGALQADFGASFTPNYFQPDADPTHYSTIYAFGDSLSDAGNDYILSLHVLPTPFIYDNGRFSNGNTWVQDLSKELGLGALKPSLSGGHDFAYGGAETGQETLHSVVPIDLPSQLAQFLLDDPHPQANALYTISIGANDVIDAIGAYAHNPSGALTDITQAVSNEAQFVGGLAADGAKNFLLLNVPDLGKTPEEKNDASVATSLSALFNTDLTAALQSLTLQDHLSISVVDTFALIDNAVAHPSQYGLTNVTTPVWTGNYENPLSGTLNAHGAGQDKYLFFDHLHPTETGHEAVASAAMAALGVVA
jgi:phospholipase/lecithinase/hemolysin